MLVSSASREAGAPRHIARLGRRLFVRLGGNSLGTRLGGALTLCMLAGLAVGAVIFAHQAQSEADARSRALARQAVEDVIQQSSLVVERALSPLVETRSSVAALWSHGLRDRQTADVLLKSLIETDPARFGAWMTWTPGVFDERDASSAGRPDLDATGRHRIAWRRAGAALVLDLAPGGADIAQARGERGMPGLALPFLMEDGRRRIAAVAYAEPIIVDGKALGSIGMDVALGTLLDAIASAAMPAGTQVLLVAHDGTVVLRDGPDATLRALREVRPDLVGGFAAAVGAGATRTEADIASGPVAAGWAPLGRQGDSWLVYVEVPIRSLAFAAAGQRATPVMPLAGVVAAIMIAVLVSLRLVVTRPLERIETYVKGLRRGHDAGDCPGAQRPDEIGAIARALSEFRSAEREIGRLRRAESERETLFAESRRAELEKLADHLAGTVQNVAIIVDATSRRIMKRAEAMAASTVSSADRTRIIAEASKAADASVGSVDAAAAALREAIERIAAEMHQSRNVAAQAAERARLSGVVTEALSSQASRIGEIVAMISSIAQRTNMLALNATIEAARAGESGRGFAIVAQEVKALAKQTTTATVEVSRQIEAIQSTAGKAAEALEVIRGHVGTIDVISGAVADAVERQGEATDLIGRSVENAVAASRGVSLAIGEVDRAAVQAGDTATDMLIDVAQLSEEVARLDDEVRRAIDRIRAA